LSKGGVTAKMAVVS